MSAMRDNDGLETACVLRRAMLGDAYVDAQSADPNRVMGEFQDDVTSMAWGVWARGGALRTRETGFTDAELDELLFQIAAYCGAPAGNAARWPLQAVRAEQRDG